MTQPTPAETVPVKDFSRERKRLVFRIDGDVFEAATALPGKVLARFAKRFDGIENIPVDKQLDAFADALGMVLLPESNELFQKRLDDLEHPIEVDQASDVIQWLLEAYGMRPTQPSSDSSTGPASPEPGTSLTGAAPQQVSIPATFQPTAS